MTPEELENTHFDKCVVDADSLIYESASAGTKVTYILRNELNEIQGEFSKAKDCEEYLNSVEDFFGESTDGWVREKVEDHRDLKYSIEILNNKINKIKKKVKAKNYRFFIGGGGNIRENVATILKYKGNREDLPKPYWFNDLKKYASELPEFSVIKGVEVDDAVSVNLYNDFLKNGANPKTILAYIDKDLLNTPGAHFHISDQDFGWISQEDADFNFAVQMLSGDKAVDNIQGLPDVSLEFREKYGLNKRKGVGKVTARKILDDLRGESLKVLYERVLEAYESFYEESNEYVSWDGKTLHKSAEEILDENCELLFMERFKGQRWLDYKRMYLK